MGTSFRPVKLNTRDCIELFHYAFLFMSILFLTKRSGHHLPSFFPFFGLALLLKTNGAEPEYYKRLLFTSKTLERCIISVIQDSC